MGNSIWDLFVSLGLDTKDFVRGVDDAVKTSKDAQGKLTSNLSLVGGAVVAGGIAAVGVPAATTDVMDLVLFLAFKLITQQTFYLVRLQNGRSSLLQISFLLDLTFATTHPANDN